MHGQVKRTVGEAVGNHGQPPTRRAVRRIADAILDVLGMCVDDLPVFGVGRMQEDGQVERRAVVLGGDRGGAPSGLAGVGSSDRRYCTAL